MTTIGNKKKMASLFVDSEDENEVQDNKKPTLLKSNTLFDDKDDEVVKAKKVEEFVVDIMTRPSL